MFDWRTVSLILVLVTHAQSAHALDAAMNISLHIGTDGRGAGAARF
jgi:hypothetical protein